VECSVLFKVELIVLFKYLKWTNNSTLKWTNKSTAKMAGQNPTSNYNWVRYNRWEAWSRGVTPLSGFFGDQNTMPLTIDDEFELNIHHINYPGWSRTNWYRAEPRYYDSVGRWCLPYKSVMGRNSLTIYMVVIPTEEVIHARLRQSNVQSYRPEMF
jgi:hypothetical protein